MTIQPSKSKIFQVSANIENKNIDSADKKIDFKLQTISLSEQLLG